MSFPTRSKMLALALLGAVIATAADASAQSGSSSGGFFGGLLGHSSTPAPAAGSTTDQTPDEQIGLANGPKKPGVELYVSVAHLYMETGKFAEAEDQYKMAQKVAPDDIRVLLGYAMLKDQVNQPDEALKLYRQAVQKHPKQPSVHNNLAVHFVRYNMVPEAIESAKRAVDLRPQEQRYRNNLAALYVEAGQPQEAFKQLRAVYDEPVAHYNLAFLLNKRGLKPAALQEFTIALQMSPGLAPAKQWIERLSRERAEHETTAMSTPPQQRPATMEVQGPAYQRVYAQPAMNAPQPPQLAPQPQIAPPPQYRVSGPAPGQAPPQIQQPQVQAPPAPQPTGAVPYTASRELGVRIPPPEPDSNTLRRLPAVSTPGSDVAYPDQAAPNPPDARR